MQIAEIFSRYFRVVEADTLELRRVCYRLRYDVYCVEHKFLDATHYPDQLEFDEYDDRSLHALLQHIPTGAYMGTVRLIMPLPGAKRLDMPFAELCHDPRLQTGEILPFETTAEVSRFAISKAFRRRATDGTYPDEHMNDADMPNDRRLGISLSMGLIVAITKMSIAAKITHLCAVMDPALLRLLHAMAIEFLPLGPRVDYHGWRQPCFAQGMQLLEQLRKMRPDYWDLVTNGGRLDMRPTLGQATITRAAV
ncbi:MAG: PEP-CTERM/exosortase system-associated acyltransferase [Alphaproteobacteria bacterium]|nr:PEP-CTERM/exosortase system-associated acyltransferase [Alphaproteobacteria bacterium]